MIRTEPERDTQAIEYTRFPSLRSGLMKVFMVNLCCIPIRFIFNSAPTIAKIGMCTGSVLFFALLIFLSGHSEKKHTWATPLDQLQDYIFYIILFCFYFLFLEGYKSQELFGYRRYIMVAFNFYLSTYLCFTLIKCSAPKWSNNEPWPLLLCSVLMTHFCIVRFPNMVGRDISMFCLKLFIGVLYLLVTTIAIHSFINKKKNSRPVSSLLGWITLFIALLISFPFYVRSLNISVEQFDIFLSVYAALIGGGVTLLGVAWTIKQNNDDKKNDIRLQNKPIMYALILNWIQESHYAPIELCLASEKKLSTTKIFLKTLVNTDIAIAIVKKVTINDVTFIPETNNVLAKNQAYNFVLSLTGISINDTIMLHVEDIFGTPYCYLIKICHSANNKTNEYSICSITEFVQTK